MSDGAPVYESSRGWSVENRKPSDRLRWRSPMRGVTPPTFASLDDLQSALAENEALLSFQVGLWETYEGDYGGGSWLIAVTKNRRTVHRLPDRTRLSPVVPIFVGLLEGGAGTRDAGGGPPLQRTRV